MADVRLDYYQYATLAVQDNCPSGFRRIAYIYFPPFKSLLQVLVYGLWADLANQRKIRDSYLLFLRGVEGRLLDIRFPSRSSAPASILRLCSFISLWSSTDTLFTPDG